ncbi:hypothetical protein Trydic_g19416 [Trypoxylus dichotomus]
MRSFLYIMYKIGDIFPHRGIIAGVISAVTVGVTVSVVYLAAPITVPDVCKDIEAPTKFEASRLKDDGTILTWNRPAVDANCQVYYEVSVYVNDVLVSNVTTQDSQYILESEDFASCSVIRYELIAVSDGQYASNSTVYVTEPDLVFPSYFSVTEVTSDSVTVIWDNAGYELCTIELNLDDNVLEFDQPISGNQVVEIRSLPYCNQYSIELKVTASHTGTFVNRTVDFARQLVFPDSFAVTEVNDASITVTWDHAGYEFCTVALNLDSNALELNQPITGNQVIDIRSLTYCNQHSIQLNVAPSVSETPIYRTIPFTRDLVSPKSFAITEVTSGSVTVIWDHAGYELCDVELNVDDKTLVLDQPISGNQLVTVTSLAYCSQHTVELKVTAYQSGRFVNNTIDFTRELVFPNSFAVTDAKSDSITVTWDHALYELCTIKLNLDGNTLELNQPVTGNQVVDIKSLAYCSQHSVEMNVATSDTEAPVYRAIPFTRPTSAPPATLEVATDTSSVSLHWQNSEDYQHCRFSIMIAGDEEDAGVISSNPVVIPTESLSKCQVHTLDITFTDELSQVVATESLNFRPFQPMQDITANLLMNSIINIKWITIGGCSFDYSFECDCEPKSSSSTGLRATVSPNVGSYSFEDCPLHVGHAFSMSINPQVVGDEDNVYVPILQCQYEYLDGGSGGGPTLQAATEYNSEGCPAAIEEEADVDDLMFIF